MLHPEREDSYYRERDLVPPDLWEALLQAQVEIVNYHAFLPRDAKEIKGVASNTRKLLRGGKPEVDDAFQETPEHGRRAHPARASASGKGEIVVLNDEAHHCYQDKLLEHPDDDADKEDKERNREARVWFRGLARPAPQGRASRPSTTSRRRRTTSRAPATTRASSSRGSSATSR